MLPMQLCEKCKALPIKETIHELAKEAERFTAPSSAEIETQEASRLQSWHADLSGVNQSSSSCQLCNSVLQGLRADRAQRVEDTRHSGDWPEPPNDFDDDILCIKWYSNIQLNIVAWQLSDFEKKNIRPNSKGKLSLHIVTRVTCNGGDQAHSSWDGYGEIKAELQISCKEDLTERHIEIDQTLELHPLCKNVMDQVRFWLSVCSEEHPGCPRAKLEPLLPHRVIDIGTSNSGSVLLLEQDQHFNHTAPYAALSHCWGPSQPFTTTVENLGRMKEGISIARLPQTFQDAIVLAREIGIRYIWIDSLCIIQDDVQDWQRESARMRPIYEDATIVIGASNAAADSEGFLHTRETETVSFGGRAEFIAKLLPPEPQRLSTASDPVTAEALGTRAWCLQERYLPRRMILIGTEQMYWECRTMLASESGNCVAREGGLLGKIQKTAAIDLSIRSVSGQSLQKITEVNYFDWYAAVREYATRNITKESDRLPALAGLARAVDAGNLERYLAGIWRKGLIEGLLWCRADQNCTLSRPRAYRAPSWSWASVEGAINFTVYNFYDRCRWKWVMANFESVTTYVDNHFENLSADRFGGIKAGWLKLRGPLLPIISVTDYNKISCSPSENVMVPLRSTACDKVLETTIQHNGKTQTIYLDGGFDTEQGNPEGRLFILLLARLPDPQSLTGVFMDIRFGLILEALAPDAYKRVGIIDGVVKFRRSSIVSRISGKVHLEDRLWKQHEVGEEDGDKPNLQGPDPFGGLERTLVTIV